MDRHEPNLDPDRLFQASEAVMRALKQGAQRASSGVVAAGSLSGLGDFTPAEVRAAMAFLVRLGYVVSPGR